MELIPWLKANLCLKYGTKLSKDEFDRIIKGEGDQITVYYDENTYAFTKLGHLDIDDIDAFRELLGTGDVTVEFSVEWTE